MVATDRIGSVLILSGEAIHLNATSASAGRRDPSQKADGLAETKVAPPAPYLPRSISNALLDQWHHSVDILPTENFRHLLF